MKLHMIVDKSGVVVDIDTARRCSGIDVDDSNGFNEVVHVWRYKDVCRHTVGMFPFQWSLISPTQTDSLMDFLFQGSFLDWRTLKGLETHVF